LPECIHPAGPAVKAWSIYQLEESAMRVRALFVGLAGGMLAGALISAAFAQSGTAERRLPPPAQGSTAIICRSDEPGARLLIDGRVVDQSGRAVAGASVTVYNTDASGLYNPPNSPTREPRINGSVMTDSEGRFQVLTVRPGSYPDGSEPRHVHFDVTAPGYQRRYSDVWFEGDPLITPERTAKMRRRTGEHTNEITKVERVEQLGTGLELVKHSVELVRG
jgi:hypothetical protein